MLGRRDLLMAGLGGGVALAGLTSPFGLSAAFADVPGDKRFVFIVLRGAMDGLNVVVPYGDASYRNLRRELAMAAPGETGGVSNLDGFFGLHPKLTQLSAWYGEKALLPIQAVATAYRDRSHFDGQDLLETGGTTPHAIGDGWLNRSLAALGGQPRLGLAVSDQVPLVIRGKVEVASWAPSNIPEADSSFIGLVQAMYRQQPQFETTLTAAISATQMADQATGMNEDGSGMSGMNGGGNAKPGQVKPAGAQLQMFTAAGKMLADPNGPRIAVLEVGGWDTHTGQGTIEGRLGHNLELFDAALAGLRQGLGDAWSKTVILAATEFGRTAAPNGTGGTDHGTASAAFMMGGAVAGGRVLADWPGLASGKLYQDRDLAPTLDLRAVTKSVLRDHLGIGEAQLDEQIFPGSRQAKPMTGLLRA
jgi:uncharacterized protein (DUF1501 family)